MFVLSRRKGQRIRIGTSVVLTVLHTSPGQVRIGVEAPPDIAVRRDESVDTPDRHADRLWYVMSPSGRSHGPACTQVMTAWFAEGRITGDTLVRRDGCSTWRMAKQVFRETA